MQNRKVFQAWIVTLHDLGIEETWESTPQSAYKLSDVSAVIMDTPPPVPEAKPSVMPAYKVSGSRKSGIAIIYDEGSVEQLNLLDKMLTAIKLNTPDIMHVIITDPSRLNVEGVQKELNFLSYVLILSAPAFQVLTGEVLLRHRGKFLKVGGLSVFGTLSPRFLLESPDHKRTAWEDLQTFQKQIAKANP